MFSPRYLQFKYDTVEQYPVTNHSNGISPSVIEYPQNITDNSNMAQISLAVAGLGILFGAAYGVKRQVYTNSRQISLNRNRIIDPIIGSNSKTPFKQN